MSDHWIHPGRRFIAIFVMFVLGFVFTSTAAGTKPNIVLIYIDDWAWNGSPVAMDEQMKNSRMPVLEMPNLERLAKDGMTFSRAYASPQCSPGRACVQTGQSSARSGYTVYMNPRGQAYYNNSRSYRSFPVIPCVADETLDPETKTIPEQLAPLGYASAHVGKWHLRGSPADEGYAVHDGDTNNTPGNTLAGVRDLPDDITDPKLMFSVTRKAIAFMDEQVKAARPFYLQISHYAMHSGRECLPVTRDKYAKHPVVQAYYKSVGQTARTVRRKQDPAIWLGMGEDLDGRIGAVLERLDTLGIADNTYVIVVSDNGYRHNFLPGLTQPLHAHKWWVWDGGLRVPMIVRGPGIKPGTRFHANVINYDFLPTFVDWAGGDVDQLSNIDGVSLAPYLSGKEPDEAFINRPLYFHYPHYRSSMPHSAMIRGSKKLMHFYEKPDVSMLFDLSVDPGEVKNIAGQHAETHQQMFNDMFEYFKQVGARLPKPNPDYDPEVYKQDPDYDKRMRLGAFEGERPLQDDEGQ